MSTEFFNILIIEDNLGDVRLIQEVLKELHEIKINLFIAHTLEKGKKYIATEAIDVILLDLNLPDSKGLSTFQSVHRFALNIPIIIFSVLSDKEIVYQALKEGAHAYFVKGTATKEALVSTIRYCRWSYYPA